MNILKMKFPKLKPQTGISKKHWMKQPKTLIKHKLNLSSKANHNNNEIILQEKISNLTTDKNMNLGNINLKNDL